MPQLSNVTADEQRRLSAFAERAFPSHIGASAALAALRDAGWELPVLEPAIVAMLVLERWFEIDEASLKLLRELASWHVTSARQEIAALATRQGELMLARVSLYAQTQPAQRSSQNWTAPGMYALHLWRESPRLSKNASVWIFDALQRGWSDAWSTAEVDAALQLLDVQLSRQLEGTQFAALSIPS